MTQEFEWDERKRVLNLEKHFIDFFDAVRIWGGPILQRRSDQEDEERYVAYGIAEGSLIAVVWTPRGQVRRIISARATRQNERKEYARYVQGRAHPQE